MVGTITPVVHGDSGFGKLRWLVTVIVYTLASVIGGALLGMFLAYLGGILVTQLPIREVTMRRIVGGAAVVYAAHEVGFVRLPHLYFRRQVPLRWRYNIHPLLAMALYGLILGAGFATYIPTSSYYIIALAAMASSNHAVGAMLVATSGFARALFLWPSSVVVRTAEDWDALANHIERSRPLMRQVNGLALVCAGVALLLTA